MRRSRRAGHSERESLTTGREAINVLQANNASERREKCVLLSADASRGPALSGVQFGNLCDLPSR